MARVAVEHLTKLFPGPRGETIPALRDLSLSVDDSELLVLVGPSGCGKTTTLRLLAGLEQPSEGRILFDGERVDQVPPGSRDVAMVFQEPALYPHLSVYDNLAFGLRLRGCPAAERERRVTEAVELLGLDDSVRRRPMELSGGQRQRVALGRALVRRPRLFLFDEPLSNLDPPTRAQLRDEIWKLRTQLRATMIYVTHDQDEALALGQRVAVLKQGVLQQVDDPQTLYQAPANLFVAGFVGSPPMNMLEGVLVRSEIGLVLQTVPGADAGGSTHLTLPVEETPWKPRVDCTGKRLLLGIRPEHVADANSLPGISAAWRVSATVQRVEAKGAAVDVHLATAGFRLVARWPATASVKENEQVRIVLDPRHARLFDAQTQQALH